MYNNYNFTHFVACILEYLYIEMAANYIYYQYVKQNSNSLLSNFFFNDLWHAQ
jgi:hypothetical protein